jgi:hypothetical protein
VWLPTVVGTTDELAATPLLAMNASCPEAVPGTLVESPLHAAVVMTAPATIAEIMCLCCMCCLPPLQG